MVNPLIGVFYHWAGGLASGSFYVPFRGVRRWSWETAWLVGGISSWLIAPWVFALLLVPNLGTILHESLIAPGNPVRWAYFFGLLWGLGGLTFGLTMRYLGMSLGTALALGYCATFGTLEPPIMQGQVHAKLLDHASGRWVLAGIAICILGIIVAGVAGILKERSMDQAQKSRTVAEFAFWKGLGIATFSGIMSACFAFGLTAGGPIKQIAVAHGTSVTWQGLPVLIVVLAGGFTTNAAWCVFLNLRHRSGGEYFSARTVRSDSSHLLNEKPATGRVGRTLLGSPVPLLRNYCLSSLAGLVWYLQFFFYTIGESKMGTYSFTSWTLHMASIMLFSSLWGIGLGEWRGASSKAFSLLLAALMILVLSTMVVGFGNYTAQQEAAAIR